MRYLIRRGEPPILPVMRYLYLWIGSLRESG
jgi:hypothetical protein